MLLHVILSCTVAHSEGIHGDGELVSGHLQCAGAEDAGGVGLGAGVGLGQGAGVGLGPGAGVLVSILFNIIQ